MKTTSLVRSGLMAAVVAVWLAPLTRAFRLLNYGSGVFAEDQSLDAWGDYMFGWQLLVSYGCSLLVGIGLVWLLCRTWNLLLLLPVSASLAIAFYVTWLQPESVIVLFPVMQPFRPAVFSALVGLAAFLMMRLYPQAEGEPGNAVS